MTSPRAVLLTLVAAAVIAITPPPMSAQDAADVQIASPEANSLLTGPVVLRANVEPAASASNAAFYVDGRQVCSVDQGPFECEWDAGATATAHQVRVVVSLKSGGRVIRTVRTQGLDFNDKVDVDAIQVTVTVTDNNGKFVDKLPRTAFHVFEDGKPQTVSNFISENVPLELVVAVDISGSMTSAMPKLKKAVKDFLAAVPRAHQVTLLGFNDTLFALTRKTTDPAERVKAVDRLAPWGATALYDAIVRGADMLGQQIGRKALIVFTDGEDQGSHVTVDDVERRLQTSDVTLYLIGQGRGTSVERLKKVMQRLSTPTGGRAVSTDNIDELHNVFDELLEELSHQYLLGYEPTNTKRDDTWRAIRVEVDGRYNVRARQGYRAAPRK